MFAYYYTVLISLYILTLHHILFCLPVLFCLFLVPVFPSSVPSDYSKTVLSKIPMPSVLQNFENSFSFLFFSFFYYCSRTVVSIFLPPFSSTRPTATTHPQPYPLWLCPWVLYTCSLMTLPLFSPITPSLLPSGYCQFVLYLSVCGYILLAYLFC